MPERQKGELSLFTREGFDMESFRYSGSRPGDDPGETYDIREYRSGDSIRQIHWKLSGKLDDIMIREKSFPVDDTVLILAEAFQADRDPQRAETVAEVFSAVLQSFMEKKISCQAGVYDHSTGKFRLEKIRTEEDRENILYRFLRYGSDAKNTGHGTGISKRPGNTEFCKLCIYNRRPAGQRSRTPGSKGRSDYRRMRHRRQRQWRRTGIMEIRITESKRQSKTAYGKQLSGILLETALIWLSAGGGLLLFMSVLTEQERMAPILGSVLLMAVFCTATERMGKYGLYGRLGLGMVSIAGIFLFHGQLLDGMALYWNDMADILGSRAGIYLKRFETAGIQGGDAARMVFLIYLGMAAAVCGFLILKLKFYLLVLAWALVLPVLSGILGMEPDAGTWSYFLHGDPFGTESYPFPFWKETPPGREQPGIFDRKHPGMCGNAGSGILLEQFMPSEDYGSSTLVTEAKKEALDGISSLRYKKGKINTLPDGKLKECGAWSASDDTALSVTMENPDSLYLRGFVGSVYDGSSWESLDTEDAYKQRTLFYWLHQDGFYGETQLSRARAFADDDALSDKVSEVDIKNEKADSRYLYTPYEITELPAGYRKETPFADSMLKAKGLFGARNYH